MCSDGCRIFPTLSLALFFFPSLLLGNGINRNGIGAKAISMGGASAADVSDTFAATTQNPALLGFSVSDDLALGLTGVIASAEFRNGTSSVGLLDDRAGVIPEIAVRKLLRDDLVFGFSLVSEQARVADWVFEDKPGGASGITSYGRRSHHSEIIGVRGALSLGWKISNQLSVGAGIGTVYNRNSLNSPYTFQSHPTLAGFKTLLDLETEGFGMNGDVGVTWRPSEDLTLALGYRTVTRIDTHGTATGDISRQFDDLGLNQVPGHFGYDARVENTLPDRLTAGLSWRATDRTRLAIQADWTGWADAFDDLTVNLREGTNSSINGLLKSNAIDDTIPLKWQDTVTLRFGLEHEIAADWFIRGGYSYGASPVPDETALPMTAAISEHTLGIGMGHVRGPFRIDLAYQIDLPSSRTLDQSIIRSGEFEGSQIELEAHWIALTVGYEF